MMQQQLVKNIGQVKKFEIPASWSLLPQTEDLGAEPFLKECGPDQNSAVKLIFYYRGQRIDKQSGEDFVKILKKPPHQVPESDRLAIAMVLRDAAIDEWFDTYSMYTEMINGKTILFVDGLWHKTRLRNLGLFIDSDGTGTAVQEIHFTAPEENYGEYIEDAMAAIESIKWK